SNIRENNIVQTVTSAAGTMASVIFVLPGLVILGWWTGFPFWTSFLAVVAGGFLGVVFTIPLRRALVTNSDLPYPEGVAAAEVLRVGEDVRTGGAEAREGLMALITGSVASAGFVVLTSMRLASDTLQTFFRTGIGASGLGFSYSLALMGAGHLVGLSVGIAMLLGIAIGWAACMPVLTSLAEQHAPLADFVTTVWRTQLRFIGAGAMGVAATWSLLRTIGPIIGGLVDMVKNSGRQTAGNQSDRDMPLWSIVALVVGSTLLAALLAYLFVGGTAIAGSALTIALIAIPIMLVWGFLIAAICGYMAGLIGSSNSPISGVGILAVVGAALILGASFGGIAGAEKPLVALAIFITSMLFAAACSSNDNLQDLKTGQLVGAAPWRQQIALLIGVVAAAVVVPYVLNLLAQAYGFSGAPNLHTVTSQPLAAPQANLIAALAQGVIGGKLDWHLIKIGAAIGAGIVALDELCRWRGWMRMPPLAVGFGIYLPMSATLPVAVGAIIGAWYDKMVKTERAQRLGTLVASGMIVGESLFGVLNAGLIVGFNRDAPLAVVAADFPLADALGLVGFIGLVIFLYAWLFQKARA
ncbi:MAG: oligopeptide transporter, family, partial [Alphaproteobacteria bacterium]|nr:oligopeptide transporter, family [Alphaproteobacteria bacterium]